jgi:hypothetical protein
MGSAELKGNTSSLGDCDRREPSGRAGAYRKSGACRAQEIGYHPEVILAGRWINDGMGAHVAERVVRLMM